VDFEPTCLHCGKALEGRQRRTCSPRCRKAIQRPTRPLRTCKLCAQPFQPTGPGQPTVCPYDDADDYCQNLQDAQEDDQAARVAARELQECQGPGCALPVPYTGRGRPPRYCSRSCRDRDYRSTTS
jgi:hypothetical protein